MRCQSAEILKVYQILMYRILRVECWHTFDTLCSLLSSLIFIYKQHIVYLFLILCLVCLAAYGIMNS
jgi:hypothetical protein